MRKEKQSDGANKKEYSMKAHTCACNNNTTKAH